MPGVIESYIHTGNYIGVLVEVSCKTEFTAYNPELKALAKEIAMQLAACPNVKYVKLDDISIDVVEKQKAIEMADLRTSTQSDNMKQRIVQERLKKRLHQMCLLYQPYIRDQSITVEDWVKLCSTQLNDLVEVCRFVRFIVDESINPSSPDAGSGIPRKPLPNLPDPLTMVAEPDE